MKTPPNYIMKFTSPNHQNAVEANKAIITPRYTLSLTKWSPHYKNRALPWSTQVLIHIAGLPPDECSFDLLRPLLSSYCDVRSYNIERQTQQIVVTAFTSTVEAIELKGIIATSKTTTSFTQPQLKEVSIQANIKQIILDDEKTFQEYEAQGYHRSIIRTGKTNKTSSHI